MAQDFARAFYHSAAWLKCRDAYIRSVYGLCERCGESGLIVHHRELLTPVNINDPSVTLNWELLELLCQQCHNKEHGNGEPVAEGLRFDDEGNLVET